MNPHSLFHLNSNALCVCCVHPTINNPNDISLKCHEKWFGTIARFVPYNTQTDAIKCNAMQCNTLHCTASAICERLWITCYIFMSKLNIHFLFGNAMENVFWLCIKCVACFWLIKKMDQKNVLRRTFSRHLTYLIV